MFPSKLTSTFIGGIIHCKDLYELGFEIEQKHLFRNLMKVFIRTSEAEVTHLTSFSGRELKQN